MIERNDIKLIVIFVLLGFIIGPKIYPNTEKTEAESSAASVALAAPGNPVVVVDPFATTTLIARSAIVWDINEHKTLYAKDAEIPRPLASLTKMMTAYVAREHMDANATVSVESDDMKYEGLSDLRPGEKWALNDLISLTLVSSSNKGAGAVAASVGSSMDPGLTQRRAERTRFVDTMNVTAQTLNLASMHFSDPTGLDFGTELGGEGSARDVAQLFSKTLAKYPDIFESTALPDISVTSKSGVRHHVKNTNELASDTLGIIGGKTGFTDLAGGNLAMVIDSGLGHPVAIVVLGSTRAGRFSDMKQLVDAMRANSLHTAPTSNQ